MLKISFDNDYHSFAHSSKSVNCFIPIDSHLIECTVVEADGNSSTIGVALNIDYPLVFKIYPKLDDGYYGLQVMIYNRHNKTDKYRLIMAIKREQSVNYTIELEEYHSSDIEFIRDMNDSLFGQIDSIIDYHTESGLSGHMLWFNIKDKHYYCFQPEEQPLSEQVKS